MRHIHKRQRASETIITAHDFNFAVPILLTHRCDLRSSTFLTVISGCDVFAAGPAGAAGERRLHRLHGHNGKRCNATTMRRTVSGITPLLQRLQDLQDVCPPALDRRDQSLSTFVPKHNPVANEDINTLAQFLNGHERVLILTGAGISTESGIPDYRSEGVGLYARTDRRPVQYTEFLKCDRVRRRYWARNFIGWPRFSQCQPNVTHHVVAELEKYDKVSTTITQNVDGLHRKAGSRHVIELHGSAHEVVCLGCKRTILRTRFQQILSDMNPNVSRTATTIRPDGDVEIPEDIEKDFTVPPCDGCGGILKPDIVFFGDNVPRKRVQLVNESVSHSDSVLVLGSSLTVFSSYRIILLARDLNLPVLLVNIGPTRADSLVQAKLSVSCGELLSKLSIC